jgi:hypothetical protein
MVRHKPNTAMKDVGNGIMTMVTGIGFSTTSDAGFMLSGAISCDDSLPDWDFALFCEGYVEKERERVRNEDGSLSVETNEINIYEWDRNATGIIIEDKDTLARFLIVMNPFEDPLVKKAAAEILSDQMPANPGRMNGRAIAARNRSNGIDYAIRGKFSGYDFMIIHNGKENKVWIFFDSSLTGMFQTDQQNLMVISKKKRIVPYLLISRETESDRRDIIRMAFLGKTLNSIFLFRTNS